MEHKGTRNLETGRLLLRRYTPGDGQAMFDNWASDDEVTRYLTWPTHSSVEVTDRVVADWAARYDDPAVYHWGIVWKATGALIGDIAVVRQSADIDEAELGWCLSRAFWGRGVMPEAARTVLAYLFGEVGFNRVCSRHDVNNPKSGRVMAKIGMAREGVLRKAGRNNTGICDMAVWAILAEDWANGRLSQ